MPSPETFRTRTKIATQCLSHHPPASRWMLNQHNTPPSLHNRFIDQGTCSRWRYRYLRVLQIVSVQVIRIGRRTYVVKCWKEPYVSSVMMRSLRLLFLNRYSHKPMRSKATNAAITSGKAILLDICSEDKNACSNIESPTGLKNTKAVIIIVTHGIRNLGFLADCCTLKSCRTLG